MRKAYSYLRFSTPEQAKGDSYRRQMAQAVKYAEKTNLILDGKLTFEDLGVSAFRGMNSENGALRQFKEAVNQGLVPKGSVLLVESLDRISRQTAWKAIRALNDIAEAGVHIVTLSDEKEYNTDSFNNDPMSILMALLIFVRANEESEMKSQRSKAVWAKKRSTAAKTALTARGPSWLTLTKDRSSWEIDEAKAKLIRRIFTLSASGMGEHSITALLNREKVSPWDSLGQKPASGRIWNASSVAKILRAPAVIGQMVPYETIYEGGKKIRKPGTPIDHYFPRVVSNALWEAVRLLKSSTDPCRGSNVDRPLQNVLGGLGRCATCGRAMMRIHRKLPRSRNGSYLVCIGARHGTECCSGRLRLDVIERHIIANTELFLRRDEFRGASTSSHQNIAHQKSVDIAEIDTQIEILLSKGKELEHEHIWNRIKQLLIEKEKAEKQLSQLADTKNFLTARAITRSVDQLRLSFDSRVDRKSANIALRKMFAKVVVDVEASTLDFHWRDGLVMSTVVRVPTTRERQQENAYSASRNAEGKFAVGERTDCVSAAPATPSPECGS